MEVNEHDIYIWVLMRCFLEEYSWPKANVYSELSGDDISPDRAVVATIALDLQAPHTSVG